MTNTSIGAASGNGDALAWPFDEGVGGGDSENAWRSAGKDASGWQFVGSSGYVHSGLEFTGHDGAADQVDLAAGRAYAMASGVDVQGQTTSSEPSHNTTLSDDVPLVIEVPSTVTNLDMTASSLNDVWLAVDTDGTGPASQAGDVYVRHGTGLSAPGHPSVKIGQTNPDDASQDTRANPNASPTFKNVTAKQYNDIRVLSASELNNDADLINNLTSQGTSIVLPPGTYSYNPPLVLDAGTARQSIMSFGTRLQANSNGNPGIQTQGTGTVARSQLLGHLRLEGNNVAGVPGFDAQNKLNGHVCESLYLYDWVGNVYNWSNTNHFMNRVYHLRAQGDAGNAQALVNLNSSGGSTNYFGSIQIQGESGSSGVDSRGVHVESPQDLKIDFLNVGGTVGVALYCFSQDNTKLGFMNYEAAPLSTPNSTVRNVRENQLIVGPIRMNASQNAPNYVFDATGGPFIMFPSQGSGSTNVIDGSGVASTSWYFGPASDIDGTPGTIQALASAGTTV